jgi:thiamine pyrophosphate-dependent acetolactate synthase large subunit-like protein
VTRTGAHLVVEALVAASVRHLFSLSGNQILSLYDATRGRGLSILHTRHEAAAVHMADAWGRLTGEPGVALVTAGPGHCNAVSALYGALMAESPVVLLSGHAPVGQIGRGAFQEIDQAAVAAPVAKASWMAKDAARLGEDITTALELARSGRPGPVHVSLPGDVLEAGVTSGSPTPARDASTARAAQPTSAPPAESRATLALLAGAKRPLIVAGPAMGRGCALPMALGAKLAHPDRAVIATLGDGTFGYHALEFDTALRYGLPIVAVVGNDARWNADYRLQLQHYGRDRTVGCELLPSRYDRIVEAIGGHGEHVERPEDLTPAIARAIGSGRPACVNVTIEGVAAPTF